MLLFYIQFTPEHVYLLNNAVLNAHNRMLVKTKYKEKTTGGLEPPIF